MIQNSLEQKIQALTKQIEKQNSFKRNFFISIFRGLGGAIGATIIFGIGIAVIIQITRSIDYVPILNNILNSKAIESIINRFIQSPV